MAESFTAVLDIVSIIMRKLHKLVWDLNKEFDDFKAFAEWLKYMFDEISAIEGASATDDPNGPSIETEKVAEYITEYLFETKLQPHFEGSPKLGSSKYLGQQTKSDYNSSLMMSAFDQQMTLVEMTEKLQAACELAFKQPAEEMKKHTKCGIPIKLVNEKRGSEGMMVEMRANYKVYAQVLNLSVRILTFAGRKVFNIRRICS